MARWYHGTSEESFNQILKYSFRPSKGLLGDGVYLSSSREVAQLFGDHLLRVFVDEVRIMYMDFQECDDGPLDNQIWLDDVMRQGYDAVAVKYASGETELVIYNTDIIQQIDY
ncbi:hypothetical protein ABHN11_31130 [Brevibacillus centrosporus]|uniref:hypothetical protein n=1 Tax=Brevibacillus centrosporus TaxID=54910 RepID=UPI003986F147